MPRLSLFLLCRIAAVFCGASLSSAALTNGGFEASPFSTGWNVTGAPVVSLGLVAGSAQAARFSGSGQALAQNVTWAADWYVDCYFAVRSATGRQFSLIVYNGMNSLVNLRYEAGAWATFNGTAWVSEPSLGTLLASTDANGDGDLDDAGDVKNVYRMRLAGRGFGSSGAAYDLEVSDANGSTFTRTVAGITRWQAANGGTAYTPGIVKFGTEFGTNPGFWLDEVTQHTEAPPPGPVVLPYVETFGAVAHQFTAGADWTMTGGVFRNTITSTAANGIASFLTEQLGGPPETATGFLLSSKFTLVSNSGAGNTVGFGVMGSNAAFTGGVTLPYYLMDVRPSASTVRCLRVGINNTSFLPESALRTFTLNAAQPFTFEVRGTYEYGALKMDLTVRQGANSETFYVVDTVPLTVGHFGYRNRTNGGALTVECDDFTLRRLSAISVPTPPLPFARPGVVYSAPVAAVSNAGSPVTLTVPVRPPWMNFTPGPNATGTLSGTPSAAQAGAHTVKLSASDPDAGQMEQEYSVCVLAAQGVIISEFLAENDTGLEDEDGDQPDWIELFNAGMAPANVGGWWLSDDPSLPMKWALPAGTSIPAGGFLTVFASEKNRTTLPLHTNFKLTNAAGGHLLLAQPDGTMVSSFSNYPAQRADHSSGAHGDYLSRGYLLTPTPGAANEATAYSGFVADTNFTIGRGYYTSPVEETITCATPGAIIVTTTDGSTPTLTNGVQSPSPRTLTISSTTVLRAAAFAPGLAPSGPDTQSYFFTGDISVQSPTGAPPAGWPQGPVNGQILDYGMDPDITGSVTPQQMHDALRALPALSLVTDLPNLFDNERGIYVNPYGREEGYECPVSVELLQPDNAPGFHINAGLRIRGGASREGTVPKHNFHLYFRGQYGAPKLNYPLFGDEGADIFDRIDLRTAQVMGWGKDGSTAATYTRDEWNRLTHGAMGQPYTRSRYYHLYINGHYWGLYGTQERADADFAASYLGGRSEDYDVMKTFVIPHRVDAADGDNAAWLQLFTAASAGFGADAAYFAVLGRDAAGALNGSAPLLDVDSVIDYTLLRYYAADDDAPVNTGVGVPKNFYALRPRDGRFGYRFLTHDAESCMRSTAPAADFTAPVTTGNTLSYFNPRWLSQQLAGNAKYRLRFADRAQRHLYNGGALDNPVAIARWRALAAKIAPAMLAESARWGDAKSATPRTVAQWQAAVDAVETGFIATRRATLIAQLRTRGLFPSLDAPAFSPHGGIVAAGFTLSITAPGGSTVFYTTNGTDPADPAASAYTGPVTFTGAQATVKARARLSATGEWSALTEALFTLNAVPATAGNVAVSEIHYNPPGAADDTEFVEIVNLSTSRVDLSGVRFTGAMIFTFGSIVLESGERLCVVEDEASFRAAYGPGPAVAGHWSGALNNSGDMVTLLDAGGGVIDTITYADGGAWPASADGEGYSLVRIDASLPGTALDWRTSIQAGGNPGASDRLAPFAGDPLADTDKDGTAAIMEHVLGTSDTAAGPVLMQPGLMPDGRAFLTFSRRLATDDLLLTAEVSADMIHWAPAVRTAHTTGADGSAVETWAAPAAAPRHFLRLRVQMH
jgi:hypothetical protein